MGLDDAIKRVLGGMLPSGCRVLFEENHASWLFFFDLGHYFESEANETVVNQYESMHLHYSHELIRHQRPTVAFFSHCPSRQRELHIYT